MFRLIDCLSVKPDLSVFQNSKLNNSSFNIEQFKIAHRATIQNSKFKTHNSFRCSSARSFTLWLCRSMCRCSFS